MSSDDYQVNNIYRYTRKTSKQNRRGAHDNVFDNDNTREDGGVDSVENLRENGAYEIIERQPRIDEYVVVPPECHYVDPEGDFANILHKKCPVITLAQQQLVRLLDETNKFICVDAHRSPLTRYLYYCKELLSRENKSAYVLVALILVAFLAGLLLGAATCGTQFGKFNNPILNCIDNYFIPDNYLHIQDTFRCIT